MHYIRCSIVLDELKGAEKARYKAIKQTQMHEKRGRKYTMQFCLSSEWLRSKVWMLLWMTAPQTIRTEEVLEKTPQQQIKMSDWVTVEGAFEGRRGGRKRRRKKREAIEREDMQRICTAGRCLSSAWRWWSECPCEAKAELALLAMSAVSH